MGCVNSFLAKYDLSVDELLTFRLEKTVTIQVWQVGVLHLVLQIAVLVYVLLTLYLGNTWAYTEVPIGKVNAWSGLGTYLNDARLPNYNSLPYCNNASLSFAYSPTFVMDSPVCEAANPYEVTNKAGITATANALVFTTAFIEVSEVGWPCDGATNETKYAECAARGGLIDTRGNQCLCMHERTVYPVGVDKMSMSFEHTIAGEGATSGFAHISASSNRVTNEDAEPPVYGIHSNLVCANGTEVPLESGSSISMTLEQWLTAARTAQGSTVTNVALSGFNTDLAPDYRYPTRYPPFRSTGVALEINIDYNNFGPNGRAMLNNHQVTATITPEATTTQWAGNGPITHYNAYPTGPSGSATYDKVFRYRQGIVVTFRTTGRLYKFQWYYLLNAIINGIVLLSSAKTLATYYAMYLAPKSEMIKNKTREFFNANLRYADIGIKAVQRAYQFNIFDRDRDGQINEVDVVQTLALIHECTFEQAYAITHIILEHGDIDTKGIQYKLSESSAKEQENATLDFAEYMKATEPTRMIGFEKYLEMAPKIANIPHTSNREACEDAFNNARSKAFPNGIHPSEKMLAEMSESSVLMTRTTGGAGTAAEPTRLKVEAIIMDGVGGMGTTETEMTDNI